MFTQSAIECLFSFHSKIRPALPDDLSRVLQINTTGPSANTICDCRNLYRTHHLLLSTFTYVSMNIPFWTSNWTLNAYIGNGSFRNRFAFQSLSPCGVDVLNRTNLLPATNEMCYLVRLKYWSEQTTTKYLI